MTTVCQLAPYRAARAKQNKEADRLFLEDMVARFGEDVVKRVLRWCKDPKAPFARLPKEWRAWGKLYHQCREEVRKRNDADIVPFERD